MLDKVLKIDINKFKIKLLDNERILKEIKKKQLLSYKILLSYKMLKNLS